MLIKIDTEDFLDLLVERVKHFIDDRNTIALFKIMYDNLIFSGCFSGSDNENYGKIKALYEEGGV